MPVSPLIKEDGGCVVGANSYLDWSDFYNWLCDQWGADTLITAADALSPDDQTRLLIASSKQLDCYNWCGVKACENGLAWPRIVCGTLTLPIGIVEAQKVLAKRLLSGSASSASGAVNVKSFKGPDGTTITFGNDGADISFVDGACSPEISAAGTQSNDDDIDCLLKGLIHKPKARIRSQRLCG